jgi:hypothetical protein
MLIYGKFMLDALLTGVVSDVRDMLHRGVIDDSNDAATSCLSGVPYA